jgi:putative spermidine/putrescine transport system permease protein
MAVPAYKLVRRIGSVSVLTAAYLFLLGPILFVMIASFDYGARAYVVFPPETFTFDSYRHISGRYWHALWISVIVACTCTVCACAIGIPAALGVVRGKFRGKGMLLALFRAPLQIPGVVSGVAFLQAYYAIGSATGWYANGTFVGFALAHVFAATPYVIGTLVSVLQRFDGALEEAALTLGASRLATFRQVTLPVLRPALFAGALYAFMISFCEVPMSVFLAGSSYVTFPVEVFNSMQMDFEPSILAVSTLVTLASLAVVLLVQYSVGLGSFVKTEPID